MPARESVSSARCSDCGAGLADGVCPACALDFLKAPATVPTVAAKEGDLDMVFGRYLLRRKLASGGMGVVYIAEDTQLKRRVALKMIRGSTFADDAERARFTVESEAVAGLDHPNIVPIHEVGMIDAQPFFTMKLIDGCCLGERLGAGNVGQQQIARWLEQIARAVQHAHQRGVLHRDLKPGNILIDESDNAWLTDFGLAKMQNEETGLTRSSDHLGTPHYMSPELVNGNASDVSTASDVWSLGVILWEALCGKPPFTGWGAAEIMRRIAEEEPVRYERAVDRDLLTLAHRCLDKDPEKRVASAGEVADELERWLRGEPLRVRKITQTERLWKWVRRNTALAALYVALAVGGVTSFMLWQHAEKAVGRLTISNEQLGQALAISTATQLALEARNQVREDPARALLLAVESVEQTERRSGGILTESVESLHATLQQVGGRCVSPSRERIDPHATYAGHESSRELPPLFSPDGQRWITFDYAYAADDGLIAAIWEREHPDRAAHRWAISPGLPFVKAATWTASSDALVLLDDDERLLFWDLAGQPEGSALGSLRRDGNRLISVELKAPEASRVEGIAFYSTEAGGEFFCGRFQIVLDGRQRLEPFELRGLGRLGEASFGRFACSPSWDWCVTVIAGQSGLLRLGEEAEWAALAQARSGIDLATFSADGSWMACRVGVDSVWLYDLRSGDPGVAAASGRELFRHDEWIQMVEFSPSGEKVALAGQGEEVFLVPTTEGEGEVKALRLADGVLLGINFSADGRWLAAGSLDKVVSVWPAEWDGAAPEPVVLRGLTTQALTVQFSPTGDSLLATGRNPAYWWWDLRSHESGAQPRLVGASGNREPIEEIAISPAGKWFAVACGKGGAVKLVASDGHGEYVIGRHDPVASGVAFDPLGRWVASGGIDGTIKVWEMAALNSAARAGRDLPGPLHVLDVSDARIEYVRRVVIHPRGTLYATCGDGWLFEWDLNLERPGEARSRHMVHSIQYMLPDLCISPDGRWLAVARYGSDPVPKAGETQFGSMVLLFDVSSPGRPLPVAELPANFRGRTNVCFSADSRWLAASADGRGPSVWDLASEDSATTRLDAPFSADVMAGVAFSPDGQTLAFGGSDGTIHLWAWRGTRRGLQLATGDPVYSLAWLDESRLVSGGVAGRVGVWETDVQSLKQLARSIAGRQLSIEELKRFRVGR